MLKEPAKRSFLGERPPKLDRINQHKTFYIDRIRITKAAGSTLSDAWLHGIEIPLNPDLVAIIGNKGSGKSALADIVALLGNSQQSAHFSFLKRDRFRGKAGEPARQFVGELTWLAGDPCVMSLSDDPSAERVELVRYIPQGRFEALCNDHVSGKRSMAALVITVEQTRSADHHVRHRLADRARAAAVEALADRLTALRPWQGTADDLVVLPCPGPDSMRRWKAARGEAEAMLARHQSETERLTTLVRHLEAERASLSSTTGVVTDQEAAEIRAHREQAWAAHRRDLDAASADAFEAVLRHDDIIGAGRFSHMSELAKLHQNGQALAVARADLDRAVELRDRAAAALDGLDAEVAEAVHSIAPSFVSAPSLPALEDWLARREKALDAREAVRSAEQDLRAAQLDAAAATERLRAALGRAGLPREPDAGFDALLA